MMKKLAEERRQRKQAAADMPATGPGEQWGTVVGVYEVNRDSVTSRGRRVARVLLASGFVVTAYLGVNAVAPAVDSPVLVSVGSIGDSPKPLARLNIADQPVEHYYLGSE